MSIDLKYKNKEGITLQKVLNTVKKAEALTKKEIAEKVKATKSIDALLNKLTDAGLLAKTKEGNKVLFSFAEEVDTPSKEEAVSEEPKKRSTKVSKAKPNNTRTPKEIDDINKATKAVSEHHQITSLVEMEDTKEVKDVSDEVDESALEVLKNHLESRTGKEVTAILHKRNEKPTRVKHKNIDEIYAEHKNELDIIEEDNPYRFVLNFFTSILNNEHATPYFRRRDSYVVKSIYNKFKTMCDKVEDYEPDQQHLPFYRVITVSEKDMTVKVYHIDMNRIVRGVHTIFKLNTFDTDFLFSPLKRKKGK